MARLGLDGGIKGKLVVRNIGTLLSGALERPLLDADTIVAVDGVIRRGRRGEGRRCGAGGRGGRRQGHRAGAGADRQPRPSGVRRLDAAPEPARLDRQLPARRRHHDDLGRRGASAGAAAGRRSGSRRWRSPRSARSRSFRPGGVKLHAGAPVLEQGMVEDDFKDMAEAGVRLLGEVGLGGVKAGRRGQADGRLGAQIRHPEHDPHRRAVDPGLGPDRQGRRARGRCRRHRPHQRRPYRAAGRSRSAACASNARAAIEIVHNGNEKAALYAMRTAIELGQPDRVILGTDSPAGSGVQPLGILRMIAMLCSLGEVRRGDRLLLRDRQHRPHARARLRADRAAAARPISCSSTAPSTPPARRCWKACGWATCRASAWSSSTAWCAAAAPATRRPRPSSPRSSPPDFADAARAWPRGRGSKDGDAQRTPALPACGTGSALS